MKPLLLLVFGAFLSIHITKAQSLSPVVISASGAFYQNGTGMLSSTVGEMTMVETFSTVNSVLTQGFQQPFDFGVGIQDTSLNSTPGIFPNPTSGNLTVMLSSNISDEAVINVYDAIGKLVYNKIFHIHPLSKSIHLSVENLIDGMYVLEMKTKTEHYFKKINIIK